MFTISFATTNDVFADERLDLTIEQVLKGGISLDSRICARVECSGNVYDINGNRIGRWFYAPDEAAA